MIEHKCPKCGEPPRYMVGTFTVRVGVYKLANGKLARNGEKHVGKPTGPLTTYECGGKHRWEVAVE